MSEYTVAPPLLADAAKIAALERELFSDGWELSCVEASILNDACCFLAAYDERGLCSYICVECAADCGYISKVATAPEHRRRGLAMRLLCGIEAVCKRRGITELSLEVRASNTAAQALYETAGFTLAGKRPNGYDHPTEDAVVYVKNIGF